MAERSQETRYQLPVMDSRSGLKACPVHRHDTKYRLSLLLTLAPIHGARKYMAK